MDIHHKTYCSRCKDGPADVKYAKSKDGKTQYYHCRKCNNERAREYYKNNSEKVRKIIYRSMKKHQDKQNARQKLNTAVKQGTVEKPDTCGVCKAQPDRVEAHHEDYTKPLEVMWVCSGCQSGLDKQQRQSKVQ